MKINQVCLVRLIPELCLSRIWTYEQWRSEDVRGPWTTDSPGPLPILHNLGGKLGNGER